MKILVSFASSLLVLAPCAALAAPCDLQESIFRDVEGKGFELRFAPSDILSASSFLMASIQHPLYGSLYEFELGQSNGYGSYYLLLTKSPEDAPRIRDSFTIYFFAGNLSSVFGFLSSIETPKHIFIEGLGSHDYYARRGVDDPSETIFMNDLFWTHAGCISSQN